MEEAGNLPRANSKAILAGIERVSEILDGGEPDSINAIQELLREGEVEWDVEECFLGDGEWDPEKGEFQGAPVWDCVRAALGMLRTRIRKVMLCLPSSACPICI